MIRFLRVLVGLAVAVGLVAAGWWAGRTALVPPSAPLDVAEPVRYEIVEGSVGRSLRFTSVAEWPLVDLARVGTSGTVTSVEVPPGGQLTAGGVLATIDLRPVVVAAGTTPMFRDLAMGVSGPDVEQLQRFLASLGYFEGAVSGVFDRTTRTAVRAWQKHLGLPEDGVVRRGDLVFVPELPVRVLLDEGVTVGAPVTTGMVIARRVVGDPKFVIPLVAEQAGLVPLDAAVLVHHEGGVWKGRIVASKEDQEIGELQLVLGGEGGGPICGAECVSAVPIMGRSRYGVEVVVVPETAGPVVPIGAISTGPNGSTSVTGSDGSEIPVEIVEAANGLAVVEGVSVGDVIVLPVTEP